jgi:hypothetical protein
MLVINENFDGKPEIKELKDATGIKNIGKLVLTWHEKKICVYDSNLKILKSFTLHSEYNIVNIFEVSENSDIFAFQVENKKLFLLNLKNFSDHGIINYSYILFEFWFIYKGSMIFSDSLKHMVTYKIIFRNKPKIADSLVQYTCSFDSFKPHLYVDPYLLSCNNKVCLDCIIHNVVINDQTEFKIKCGFDSCNENHILNIIRLENGLSKFMIENLDDVVKCLLHNGSEILDLHSNLTLNLIIITISKTNSVFCRF